MLHCCEDWSEDALAHKPNKYCTYNLAPKCGPYSLAPRLVHGRNKNSPRHPQCHSLRVLSLPSAWLQGSSGACHKQLSKEICFAAYSNLFRHLQIYKTLILTDHITSEPYTAQTPQSHARVVQHLKMSTGCYMNTTSQCFFFLQRNTYTRDAHMLAELCVETNKQKNLLTFSRTTKLFRWIMIITSH